jgi:hypothetical protein
MRIVSLLIAASTLSVSWAQEEKKESPQPEQRKIPAALAESEAALKRWQADAPSTLAEAHTALERMLSPQTLAEIDAMSSEDGMIKYHFGLGLSIRNGWGLWRGSPLAKHMQELGFMHPDDMSGVILNTFWCKRHEQDFRLKERGANYKKYWDDAKKAEEDEENREKNVKAAMRRMMMGLRLEKREVPVVQMPNRSSGMNVRFLSPFRNGVFLTTYCQGSISSTRLSTTEGLYVDAADGTVRKKPEYDDAVGRGFYFSAADRKLHKMNPGEDFYVLGCYFDLVDCKIHRIRVPEVNEVYASVVAGERAWFAGLTNGKAVLVGVGDRDRITLPLPQEDEIPDLGLDGPSLLAVYSKTIFRLTERKWTLLHSGDILLPRSGLPAQRYGNMVFLRDEGRGEKCKRLWWLTLGEKPHLSVLDYDSGLPGPPAIHTPASGVETFIPTGTPGWDESSSYCVTRSGDLWACAGTSLVRRSKDGRYSIAIMNDSLQFTEDRSGSRVTDGDLSVSAVAALPDDTLLLAGHTGLYRLKGDKLVQELAFAPPESKDGSGPVVWNWWTPSNILVLNDQSYVLGTARWEGIYLLRRGNDGQWSFLRADDSKRGDPVVW